MKQGTIVRVSRMAAVLAVAAAVGACATKSDPSAAGTDGEASDPQTCGVTKAEIRKHVVVIHSETTKDKNYDNEERGYEAQFKAVMKGYADYRKDNQDKKNKLMLFFNGGLNNTGRVKKLAGMQVKCIKEDGYYPVFLVWSSGLFPAYGEQIAFVRNGIRRESIQPTTPFHVIGDVLAPLPRAPVILYNQLGRFLDTTVVVPAEEYIVRGHEYLPPDPNQTNILAPDVESRALDGAGVARYTALTPFRISLSVLLEDAGRRSWNGMVRRTRNTVRHPGEFDPGLWGGNGDRRVSEMKKYPRGTGNFARFFQDLERCLRGSAEKCPVGDPGSVRRELKAKGGVRITAIGHSMGAIVLNELLPLFGDLPFENVVYMAAAAGIRETRAAIVPLLESRGDVRFYNLMLHPIADAREDSGFGMIPSGSLLEWIDEIIERPKTVYDRTMGKWRNLRIAKHVFSQCAQEHMTFKVFGLGPNDPKTHGAFNDTNKKYWKPAFWGEGKVPPVSDGRSVCRRAGKSWRPSP